MPFRIRSLFAVTAFAAAAAVTATAANAQKKYDPGASDTEIKVGNIMPYSGPASAYGVIGKAQAAYFKKINEEGGINGRKITFISYDDSFSPPKAVEQARKLVESDEVLLIFQPLGTQSNSAIQKYMNTKKVPQLFVATGATKWGDPQNFPWTMGWQPNYQSEGRIYAAYILKNYPNGKIAALWQNDDAGKDQMKGVRDGLGDKAGMIIADKSYEISDPTIDSQIVALKDSGADILMTWAAPKGGGASDSQGRRARLEAGVFPRQRLDIGRHGSQAGRPRQCQGHHLDRLHQGSDRPGVEGRRRDQGLAGLYGQVFPGRRQDQQQ
jgi:ABC-type branched-subunit amino acid transport system substrate-binding protein